MLNASANQARLDEMFQRLGDYARRNPSLDRLFRTLIEAGSNTDVQRINAYRLAHKWSVAPRDVLSWMLYASDAGLFDLHWESHCPHCNGLLDTMERLGDIPNGTVCIACQVNVDNHFDQNVVVTFSVTPAIRQFTQIDDMAMDEQTQVVTGIDIATTPAFQQLFSHASLSQRESLNIRNMTIMFTDISGSTALYQRLGDPRAYNLVRDHFEVLFRQIEANSGVVVKTIGDAVMAAFHLPEDALNAALAAQSAIRQFNEGRTHSDGVIMVKIGMHRGSAIAVNLNERLDYFGNMINLAARVQGQSRANEVLLSEPLYRDPAILKMLEERRNSIMVTDSVFELAGIEGTQQLFSVTYRTEMPSGSGADALG